MEVREKIIKILSAHSDKENVYQYLHKSDDLTQLGMNSITFIKMIIVLESEFDFEFEDDALDHNKFTSLNLLCDYVEEMMKNNNVVYTPLERMDEKTLKSLLIQMISKLTNSPLLEDPSFNDLTALELSLDDANKLITEIRETFSVLLDRETIIRESLLELDNLCEYILNSL